MKKLSIVTPAYKSERHIQSYFENITNLIGFGDYEIILILNQPTEKELEIANRYKQRHPQNIRVIQIPLESIAASTNRGFLLADSEFITCVDVDDMRKPDCFSRQMETLESNPDVHFTYGDFIMVSRHGSTDGLYVRTIEFDREEASRSSIIGANHFFKKKLLEKCGYWDEQFRSGADFDFQVRAALNGNFKRTGGDALYYYTRYHGSGSAGSNDMLQQVERTVIELRYGIYDKVNYAFLPKALEYDIYHVYFNGTKRHISELVPNYKKFLEERYRKYFRKGMRKNIINLAVLHKVGLVFKFFLRNPRWTYNKVIEKIKG